MQSKGNFFMYVHSLLQIIRKKMKEFADSAQKYLPFSKIPPAKANVKQVMNI